MGEEREIIKTDNIDFEMMNNHILVRVDIHPEDGFVLKSGIIIAGSKWDEGGHVARYGVVEAVPKRLIFRKKGGADIGMEWGTEMELDVGDVVFFGKIASATCRIVLCDGVTYFLMPYQDIILRKRNEEIYPVNGYALVSKVIEGKRIQGLCLDFGDFHNEKLGTVKYIGKPNSYYLGSDTVDADASVGDTVIFQMSAWTAIENEMFASIDEELGFVQRCWIIGTL